MRRTPRSHVAPINAREKVPVAAMLARRLNSSGAHDATGPAGAPGAGWHLPSMWSGETNSRRSR